MKLWSMAVIWLSLPILFGSSSALRIFLVQPKIVRLKASTTCLALCHKLQDSSLFLRIRDIEMDVNQSSPQHV